MAQYFDVPGSNIINGTVENDFIIFSSSGGGNDTIIGNGGNDMFAFVPDSASFLWQRTITDFNAGDTIRVAASQNITNITSGNGASMQPYSVQVSSEGGINSFYVESNGDSLADVRLKFPGSFSASQFVANAVSGGTGPLTDFTLITTPSQPSGQFTAGNDIMQGSGGNDIYSALAGNDTLYGNDGNDTLQGNQGNDSIFGGSGNDSLLGGKDDDYVHGNQGDDSIAGGMGFDILVGGRGNDSIQGGKDFDVLRGELGNDSLYGELGDDILAGGKENDYLNGGDGNDTLGGELGNDTLEGGIGSDIFLFFTGSGNDIIQDFNRGEDKLSIDFEVMTTEQAIASFSGGILNLGNGNSVTLVGVQVLTASDFF